MSEGATSGDREQQKRDTDESRRQSGLEPRREDREQRVGGMKEATPLGGGGRSGEKRSDAATPKD